MAKANRVIQKPKPPAPKHLALIDPNTGLISAYVSGTNVVIGPVESKRNWRDITDVPGADKLNSDRIKRNFIKEGVLKRKPRVRLVVDSKKIEIGKGRAKVSYEVLEGDADDIELTVRSNGSVRKEKLRKNQTLDIGGSSRRKVTVTIDDPLIFVEEPVVAVEIVPPEELIVSPVLVEVPDDIIIDKKDKVNSGQAKAKGN
jgi:hypothetical protein